MWVFLFGGVIINKSLLTNIFKNLFSQRTNLHAGNLAYLTIMALVPTFIITISAFNILIKYIPLLEHPYFSKISIILEFLNLNSVSNIIINVICINLLSSGIFALLTTFEDLYKFKFKNYLRKKLYSIALAIIIIFTIIISLSISFTIEVNTFFKNIDFIIDLLTIFFSLILFYKLSTFQKLKNIYTGAIISSLFLTIFLHFFFVIINNFSNLQSYYGFLTPLMIAFLLIYYSCYIIYSGIIINFEIKKHSRIKLLKR